MSCTWLVLLWLSWKTQIGDETWRLTYHFKGRVTHLWRSDKTKNKGFWAPGVVKCRKVNRWEKLREGKGCLSHCYAIPLMPSLGYKSLEFFSGDEECLPWLVWEGERDPFTKGNLSPAEARGARGEERTLFSVCCFSAAFSSKQSLQQSGIFWGGIFWPP